MSRSSGSRGKERRSLDSHGVLGECGYCGQTIAAKKHRPLPLECFSCKGVYHVGCLRGRKPQVLLGDQLFKFTCAYCSPLGKEVCSRPYLHWVHITHLSLYNLIVGRKSPQGRTGTDNREYFRWSEDICGFIRTHWNKLMPDRKRTQSWRSTVAGTLSVNCPTIFQSGNSSFSDHGWWTLTNIVPPDPRQAITSSPPSLGKRSPLTRSPLTSPPPPPQSKRLCPDTQHAGTSKQATPTPESPTLMEDEGSKVSCTETKPTPPTTHLVQLSQRQEKILKNNLEKYRQAVGQSPRASRLLRKLKVRELQRNYGHPLFDLDKTVSMVTRQTVKYVVKGTKSYYEQIVPVTCLTSEPYESELPDIEVSCCEEVLKRLTVTSHPLSHQQTSFKHFLNGGGFSCRPLTSPYTARTLKPFVFRTSDLRPLRSKLNTEISTAYSERHPSEIVCDYKNKSIDFVYLQDHMLSAVNSFVSYFFWPVDLSECLQYPDFTCVVLYGNLVIGCAFMTPDVKVNEAYISFLAVHPEFQRVHIGKFMLYHLIQTCMGKDVTLHVSVDNPAMILYQKFGFKAEKYCLDFYEHYYPSGHHLSKHAYFMRLRR